MKGAFFGCYYESEFLGSRNYRCNATGGLGLGGNLLLLGFWEGYYVKWCRSVLMLNKPILRENGREYGFNLTVYF